MALAPDRRRKLGIALVVAGLAIIVGAVLTVCQLAEGPGFHTSFAMRRGYDQVKESVHQTFPIALVVGLFGLALTMTGARLARRDPPGV